jgi:hypothetical protein
MNKIDPTKLQEAMSYKKGTPIASIVSDSTPEAFVLKGMYRFAPGIYMTFSEYMPNSFKRNPEGLNLASLLLAPDDSAVMRVTKMDIEHDANALLEVPTAALPSGAAATYGEILKGLKRENGKGSLESAEYRLGSDGLFVHRTIQTGLVDYFFRGRAENDNEAPYAICYKYERP